MDPEEGVGERLALPGAARLASPLGLGLGVAPCLGVPAHRLTLTRQVATSRTTRLVFGYRHPQAVPGLH